MSRPRRWRGDRRDRWRRSVLASPHYSPTEKVILSATVEKMRPDGWFAVERREIQALTGARHPQRITEAWTRAWSFGHLYLITKMAYGKATRYQATFPDHVCNEFCTRNTMGLTPPVVTASPGHYTTVSAHPVTTEIGATLVVTADPATIGKTPAQLSGAPESASPAAQPHPDEICASSSSSASVVGDGVDDKEISPHRLAVRSAAAAQPQPQDLIEDSTVGHVRVGDEVDDSGGEADVKVSKQRPRTAEAVLAEPLASAAGDDQ